jgi:hypothetical protein
MFCFQSSPEWFLWGGMVMILEDSENGRKLGGTARQENAMVCCVDL